MYAQFYHNIPISSRDRVIFIFFRIWSSANPRPMINAISQSLKLALVNINAYAKVCQNIPNGLQVTNIFHERLEDLFRIWISEKPRPMINVISQSLGLELVNINVYANFHHNIPLSSRERVIFTFSEFGARQSNVYAKFYQKIPKGLRVVGIFRGDNFTNCPVTDKSGFGPRQSLDQWKMAFDLGLHPVNINVHVKFHHNIPLGSRDRAIVTFSEFGAQLSKAPTDDKCNLLV